MRDRACVTKSRGRGAQAGVFVAALLVLGGGLAGCSSGNNGTSGEASSTAAIAGSSTGAPTGTGGASSTGASTTGGTSSGGGSSTGAFVDGGCNRPGNVDGGGACVLDADCDCPFKCIGSVCQIVCTDNSDCPPGNECFDGGYCKSVCFHDSDCPSGDVCLGGVCEPTPQVCDPDGGVGQFQGCWQNYDCICPFDCFVDFRRGAVCEQRCATVADCPEADEICETDAGSCQRTTDCYGGDAGIPELGGCGASIQCACPLSCYHGQCEPACTMASDCGPVGDAGQFCEGDGGFCLPIPVCNPAAGATEFLGCVQSTDCMCPFECVVDPRRGPVCEPALH